MEERLRKIIKDRIAEYDYTYRYLAYKTGYHEQTVRSVVSGHSKPSIPMLLSLCEVLNLKMRLGVKANDGRNASSN